MNQIKENRELISYHVTKISWKGKYKRILSVGTGGVATSNPSNLVSTNFWPYGDIVSICPTASSPPYEFQLIVRKGGKKIDTIKFSSEHRADVITEALKYRHLFGDRTQPLNVYNAYKIHWSDTKIPCVLEVSPHALERKDASTLQVMSSYCYRDVECLRNISDSTYGFAVVMRGTGRMYLFSSDRKSEIVSKMVEQAESSVGVTMKVAPEAMTTDQFRMNRFGVFSKDEHLTSMVEFLVQKITPNHSDPIRRLMCISETCLLERDPTTYFICTLRPLNAIFALVRPEENPQEFLIEYSDGETKKYSTTEREALLATLLDGVRASGNRDVHVRMTPVDRGMRIGPLKTHVDEEIESHHLRFLAQPPPGISFAEAIARFNACVSYSGLLHAVTQESFFAENKEKLINAALAAIVSKEVEVDSLKIEVLGAQFQALRRLVASKAGFAAFTALPGFREKLGSRIVRALKRNNEGVAHVALDTLCALMVPMHEDGDLRQEQLNKASLLSTKKFLESLLDMWCRHVVRGSGALVVVAMLDFLNFALCAPYSETTDEKHFDILLGMVADRGKTIFRLFQHPSLAIVKGAGLLMKSIIEEGDIGIAEHMQDLALSEAALPRHMDIALYTQVGARTDRRMMTVRQLSRYLVALWTSGHDTAHSVLSQMMPAGLLDFLHSKDGVPEDPDLISTRNLDEYKRNVAKNQRNVHIEALEKQLIVAEKFVEKQVEIAVEFAMQHWRERMGIEKREPKMKDRPVILRKRRERLKSEANWPMFYYQFTKDHTKANLIWNNKTREELRESLENELRAFDQDRNMGILSQDVETTGHINVSWNFAEFEVSYPSLTEEIKIGDYYLRVLLERGDVDGNLLCEGDSVGTPVSPEKRPPNRKALEFFNDLYHRFLLSSKPSMKTLCLQAMTVVYGRYSNDIGSFHDTKYIMAMLDKCTDLSERDRLLQFISKLVLVRANAKELMDSHGIRILVDLLTLAHLHKNRAVIHTQSNVIEAGPNMKQHAYKEWHCRVSDEQQGPFSYDELCDMYNQKLINPNTRVWAQGMDGWKPIHSVAQLKWRLVGSGTAVLNESEIASLVLDILIKICRYSPSRDNDGAVIRPLPRVKRLLSEAGCLPHIVQLLLTFDPILVEKTALLLTEIVHDNPVLPRMYLTGVFFFLLMYTGSNILPIARFLQLTNARQAFRSEALHSKELLQRSILGPILPEAMVCYLENHGAEKFSEIFLGEFDTPEAIWNSEMRRMMIERIASHISDFSPRLSSNTRALYQYCPVPAITYPQLEAELFCNIFYLRHLCNVARFPDWPIKEPVQLLKDVLDTWKKEVEKKPPSMSVDDAFKILKIALPSSNQNLEESTIRKAYFKLAQLYHPDKNPEGRDMFEKVNKAYEFLCSRSARTVSGPDPKNIVLILQTQSIIFGRYSTVLEPYKYSGYPMLVRTIELETRDDSLFSKTSGLLSAAAEVAYHTVKCSALNAEELRREGGLEALLEAFSRCSGVLSKSSKPEDVAVEVSANVLLCFTVAARFQACRERIAQMTTVIGEVCRILYFKHLTRLASVAAQCISALSADSDLQLQLMQHGAVWHLLLFLFQYDYTMDEGGVERSESSNQQEASNKLARDAVYACARLGGYLPGEEATPSNPLVRGALAALLTPYVTKLLGTVPSSEVLKALNSNTRNPHLIWDNSTRLELIDYLTEQQQKQIKGGLASVDPNFGAQFVYSSHKKELIVGDIFVRVYNEQPSFVIQDPKRFAESLLSFIGSQVQFLHSTQLVPVQNETTKVKYEELEAVLEAYGNLLKANPGVETTCIGHFRLLFSLLLLHNQRGIISKTLCIIIAASGNRQCVDDLTQSEVLGYLLLLLVDSPVHLNVALEALFGLMVNTGLVKEAFAKGILLYLLDVFCSSSSSESSGQARTQAAETLNRIMADRLVGPRIRAVLSKFIPRAIVDAYAESHNQAQVLFDSETQNPELIWNIDSRKAVCSAVRRLSHEFADRQRLDLNVTWNPPDSESVPVYCAAGDELVVGGVYLRLFVANPGWVLRKPKEFLVELLDTTLDHMSRDHINAEHLETLVSAFSGLLRSQPLMSDQLPSMGYLPRILKCMRNPTVSKFGITIVHQLAMSQACVESLSRLECIQPLQVVLSRRPELSQMTCDALSRLFASGVEDLVDQALKSDLIPALLSLLDTSVIRTPEEAEGITASARANAVAALKSMTRSPFYGERVNSILLKSDVWAQYKDQRHDLFLTNTQATGYLTGGSSGIAGSLTYQTYASASQIPPREKPPLWEY